MLPARYEKRAAAGCTLAPGTQERGNTRSRPRRWHRPAAPTFKACPLSPWAPKRLCARPGCGRLVSNTEPCPLHGKRPWQHNRPTASERGYGLAWRRLRAQVLAEEPVCRYCGWAPSTQADHIVPRARGGSDDRSNIAGSCKRCHESKSGREGSSQPMSPAPLAAIYRKERT